MLTWPEKPQSLPGSVLGPLPICCGCLTQELLEAVELCGVSKSGGKTLSSTEIALPNVTGLPVTC